MSGGAGFFFTLSGLQNPTLQGRQTAQVSCAARSAQSLTAGAEGFAETALQQVNGLSREFKQAELGMGASSKKSGGEAFKNP